MKNAKEIEAILKPNETLAYLVRDNCGNITAIEREPIDGYQSYHHTGVPYSDSMRTSELIILSVRKGMEIIDTEQGLAIIRPDHRAMLNGHMISNTTPNGHPLKPRNGIPVYRIAIGF